MNAAAKEKSSLAPRAASALLAPLRWLLLLIVTLGLAETRVWGFASQPETRVGEIAAPVSDTHPENTLAWSYDASDSPVAAKGPVIIGENMNRVNAYAGKVGGETIDGWLAGRKWTQPLNDEFVATVKAQGRQIQDIGPDFGRRLQNRIDPSLGRPPSSVYGGERQSLLDYGNYQQLYERAGKYQGGVPGFDP